MYRKPKAYQSNPRQIIRIEYTPCMPSFFQSRLDTGTSGSWKETDYGILGIGGGGGFFAYLRFFGAGAPSVFERRGRVLSGRAVMCVDS